MICQICHKEEATVHFTEIIDSKVNELNLCKKCAEKKGIALTVSDAFSEFISGMAGDQAQTEDDGLCCSRCGLTFKELRQGGRLGCGECYTTFEASLSALIKNIQKGPKHIGKSPPGFKKEVSPKIVPTPREEESSKKKEMDKEVSIEELRAKIKVAIAVEEYEKAAHLRDWIKDLESKQHDK